MSSVAFLMLPRIDGVREAPKTPNSLVIVSVYLKMYFISFFGLSSF